MDTSVQSRSDRARPMSGNRGAAYVLALITMLVGTVLALAMLRAANSYFLAENSRNKKNAAVDMAHAGVDYAYWDIQYQGQSLPYSADVTLSTGSFHVEAVDDGSRDRSTMLITSTGTCNGHSYTLKRVTLGLLPYHYAWCENKKIETGQTIASTSVNRGLRTNDSISLSDYGNNITTGLWAANTIWARGTAYPQNPFGPPIAFPDINYGYYYSIANNVYNYDITFTSINCSSDTLVYVNGDVSLNLYSSKYRGGVTIVATGNITVRANMGPYDSNSFIALITTKTITIQYMAWDVTGAFYAHKSDNSAKIQLQGYTTVTGTVSADDITLDHPVTVRRDPDFDLDDMRRLKLPGL